MLCGSLFDYGFAGDSNYVQDIHHRLFESVNRQGEIRRNDIVAINVCRAREHGIPGYNAFRELCGLPRASQFQDFTDTMSFENAAKLQMIYKCVTRIPRESFQKLCSHLFLDIPRMLISSLVSIMKTMYLAA